MKKSPFTTCLIAIFLFSLIFNLYPATYYVDATNGNDNNNGLSSSAAWKTIAKVNNSQFLPGDNILFKRGETWREQLTVPSSGSPGNSITFGAYGSGVNPIISGADEFLGASQDWQNQGGNVWRRNIGGIQPYVVLFNNGEIGVQDAAPSSPYEWRYSNPNLDIYSASNPSVTYNSIEVGQRSQAITTNSKNYIVIDGLTAQGANGEQGLSGNGIIIGGNHNVIKNCTLRWNGFSGTWPEYKTAPLWTGNIVQDCISYENGVNGFGVASYAANFIFSGNTIYGNGWKANYYGQGILSHCDSVTIANNTIYNNGTGCPTDVNCHGIYIWRGYTGTVIYENEVYGQLHGWGIATKSSSVAFRNLIHDNNQWGLGISDNEGNPVTSVFSYNIIYGNNRGIVVSNPGSGDINLTLYNNTTYDNSNTTTQNNPTELSINHDIAGLTMRNNIFFAGASENFVIEMGDGQSNADIDNNLLYGASGISIWYDGAGRTWSYWRATAGFDTHGLNADPHYNNPNGRNFSLDSNSPCIDTGTNVGFDRDFQGTIVPQGIQVDIGALEYSITHPNNFRVLQN